MSDEPIKIDPKKQFSKKLAWYGAIAWGVFIVMVIALLYFRPETAMAVVYMLLIMTVNKAIDTLAYTKNSTTEKIILGILDKTKMELSLKGVASSVASSIVNTVKGDKGGDENEESTVEEPVDEPDEEEGGNG